MSDQVRSSRFQALFESALRDYEQKAKMTLSKHPLAEKLEKCDSVESITGLLLDQAPTLGNSQGSDNEEINQEYHIGSICSFCNGRFWRRHRPGLSESVEEVFRVSDTHSTEFQACESDTYWARCPTRCAIPILLGHQLRIALTLQHTRQPMT